MDRYFTMIATHDPTPTDDTRVGCHTGTRWTNITTKRQFVCTDGTTNGALWYQTTIPSAFYETITTNLTTSNTNYQFVQSIPFIGATTVVLQGINIVAVQSGGAYGVTFDVRVRDVTNKTTICEVTGLHSLTKTIFSLGALANLPSAEAVFDIELRRSGTATTDTATIFACVLKYY